uniref:Uncharacterized protein n=1 Tax=Timema bartmani TaxID=61472 RepID=A0A7R9FC87_9NEOP|nr:unnamed protein product [Timema bartmani]
MSSHASGITNFLSSHSSDITNFLSSHPSGITNFLSSHPSGITNFLSSHASGITNFLSSHPSNITNFRSSHHSGITNSLSSHASEVSISQSQQQTLGLSDQDYEELLERLRVADFLYTEYSLEEVIYQLAKVMFSQSLNRGSGEAQEALQKFTSFLESEAEQGHISRSLEKKVLDVLIASLTDTLTEHPHLVSAAREGLGSNLPKTAGNQLLHQLLLLNPAGASGETASAGTDINKSDKSHQSTLAKTRAESNKTT